MFCTVLLLIYGSTGLPRWHLEMPMPWGRDERGALLHPWRWPHQRCRKHGLGNDKNACSATDDSTGWKFVAPCTYVCKPHMRRVPPTAPPHSAPPLPSPASRCPESTPQAHTQTVRPPSRASPYRYSSTQCRERNSSSQRGLHWKL